VNGVERVSFRDHYSLRVCALLLHHVICFNSALLSTEVLQATALPPVLHTGLALYCSTQSSNNINFDPICNWHFEAHTIITGKLE